jgi:hypothetical protein
MWKNIHMSMEMRLRGHGKVLDTQNQYQGKAKEESHVLIQNTKLVADV